MAAPRVACYIGQNAQVILPGISIIERLCTDALVAAERQIETRIVSPLSDVMKDRIDALLTENVDGRISRFIRCPAGYACMPERVAAPI